MARKRPGAQASAKPPAKKAKVQGDGAQAEGTANPADQQEDAAKKGWTAETERNREEMTSLTDEVLDEIDMEVLEGYELARFSLPGGFEPVSDSRSL